MKTLAYASVIAMVATVGFADVEGNQDNVLGTNNSIASGQIGDQIGGANTTGNVSGNDQTIITHEAGSGTTTVTNNSTSYQPNGYINNPGLTTSGHDTCFGSSSGGISGPGFGISGGSTVVDENCVMLKQAKILVSMGLKDAAVLLMMNTDPDIAEALWGAYPELADHLTQVRN